MNHGWIRSRQSNTQYATHPIKTIFFLLIGIYLTACGSQPYKATCQTDQDCPEPTACYLGGTTPQCLPKCTATTDCMISTEQCQALEPNSLVQVCQPKA